MGRAERTHGRLREVSPGVKDQAHIADLSSLDQTKQVGARIAAEEPRIDVLIKNAGNILVFAGNPDINAQAASSGDLAHAAWFFPDHRQKIFRLYRSQAINISYSTSGSLVFPDHRQKIFSYSTDHRQKIFRTLPQMAWGGE
jgi:hypothetical protein